MACGYKSFKIDPYLCSLRVYVDLERFNKDTGAGCSEKLLQAATYRCDYYFAVYIPSDENGMVSIRTAAHEAYHVADFVMERVGLEYKSNSCNEHVAYLVGHVCECIFEAAKKLSSRG